MHMQSEVGMADNGEPGPAPGGSGGAAGPAARTGGADRITISINNTAYQVDGPSMTGADLKRLAKEPMNRLVIRIEGGPAAGPGGDGEAVLDDQSVNLAGGMRFRIVNAGAFGGTLNHIKTPDARHLQPRPTPRGPGDVP